MLCMQGAWVPCGVREFQRALCCTAMRTRHSSPCCATSTGLTSGLKFLALLGAIYPNEKFNVTALRRNLSQTHVHRVINAIGVAKKRVGRTKSQFMSRFFGTDNSSLNGKVRHLMYFQCVNAIIEMMSSFWGGIAVEVQENCVRHATFEGLKAAAWSLALSATVVLGAARVSPNFARSLNVSAKTALIVSSFLRLPLCHN